MRAKSNTLYKNGFNAKTNGDLTMVADSFAYNDRAPSGSFSLSIKKYLGEQSHLGVVLRLRNEGAIQQWLEIIIQDDLTNLDKVYIRAEGSLVQS